MINPIEAKKRMVQDRIAKSFESGINVSDEVEIEKAHKDGDIHPKHPNWVWVSSAAGGKGDWRIANGRTHKKAGASTTNVNKNELSVTEKTEFRDAVSKYIRKYGGQYVEFDKFCGDLFQKYIGNKDALISYIDSLESKAGSEGRSMMLMKIKQKLQKSTNKVNDNDTDWWNDADKVKKHMDDPMIQKTMPHLMPQLGARYDELKKKQSNTPAPRKPGSTDEIERMSAAGVRSSILGLNNIGTNVKDKGSYFHIEFDTNDFSTHGQRSPQIDRIAKFLEGMGASCVIGKNEIKAYKKVEPKKNEPKKLSELKVGDVVALVVKKYNRIPSKSYVTIKKETVKRVNPKTITVGEDKYDKQSGYLESKYRNPEDYAIMTQEELINQISNGKYKGVYRIDGLNPFDVQSDPRDKIAQDAGFKDYAEMKGWQEYVTSKSLLKKPSTKGDSRKELETAVDKYEKEHLDVIKRRKSNK